ncbi:MAG: deoxyguanosinetriphosphate triphosphohydrolase [Dehalococcoidia bacterium]
MPSETFSFGRLGRPVIRELLEQREESLSPFATRSRQSRGRERPEEPSDLRTEFQRDRDRIIHTNAFRRLKHKTQVLIAPTGDHYVTRLTHTLEVAQIARTITRALNLSEDLVEATGLGHDLGHTPFGHLGEQTLNQLYPEGFAHSAQSLRVVELLEKNGQGLNLTWEVRQGILFHSKPRTDLLELEKETPALTLEAQVVRIADAVAYLSHDINDAIRAGLLTEKGLPSEVREHLGIRHSQRINSMVWDIVEASWPASGAVELAKGQRPSITMSPTLRQVTNTLREFLFQRVYLPAGEGAAGQRAREVVHLLYRHLCQHPEQVPPEFFRPGETAERAVVDYLAGMTDNFALRTAEGIQPGISQGVFQWLL